MEGTENSAKMCIACFDNVAHPVYSGYCEDCFVDNRLVKAYGAKPKDRGAGSMPHGVAGGANGGVDSGPAPKNGLDGLVPNEGREDLPK